MWSPLVVFCVSFLFGFLLHFPFGGGYAIQQQGRFSLSVAPSGSFFGEWDHRSVLLVLLVLVVLIGRRRVNEIIRGLSVTLVAVANRHFGVPLVPVPGIDDVELRRLAALQGWVQVVHAEILEPAQVVQPLGARDHEVIER